MLLSYQEFIQTYQPVLNSQGNKARMITKSSTYFSYKNQQSDRFILKKHLTHLNNQTIDKDIQLQWQYHQLFPKKTIEIVHYTKRQQGDFLEYLIIMQQANSSLEDSLSKHKQTAQIYSVILMILQLLLYLQENNYVHGNINANNLLWHDNQLKLTDFKSQESNQFKDQIDVANLIIYLMKRISPDSDFKSSLENINEKGSQLSQSVLSLIQEDKSEFNTVILCYGLFKKYEQFIKKPQQQQVRYRSQTQTENRKSFYFQQQRQLLKTVTPNKIHSEDSEKKLQNYTKNNSRIVIEQVPELYKKIRGEYHDQPIRLDERTIYKGEINKNHQAHGLGIRLELGKKISEGVFQNGVLLWGRQLSYLNNQLVKYTGYFNNEKKEGVGILDYGNQKIYKGYLKNNKPDGIGILYSQNGIIYEGEFRDGKKHGYGTQTQMDQSKCKYLVFSIFRVQGKYLEGKPTGSHKIFNNKGQYIKDVEFD